MALVLNLLKPCRSLWLAVVALLFLTSSLARAAEPDALRIQGSTTLLPAVHRLAEAFSQGHPGVEFDVRGGGSVQGIQALISSSADIASSSRFLNTEEVRAATSRGIYPVPFQIAHDALIPIVHKSNTVRGLSLEELGKVFRGGVRNWKALGGPDLPVQLVMRDQSSGTLQVWRERIGGEPGAGMPVTRVESSADVVRAVSRDAGAIGYIGLAGLSAAIKPLRVDGVIGSMGNVRSGRYALARPLFLFTNGWPEGAQLDFINFVLDPGGGQRVIEEAGLLPLYPRDRR